MLEHKMLHLFGGRMDAWGQDYWDDTTNKMSGRAVRGPVTHDLIRDHLEGRQGVGIYPMWFQDERWWVKWGCCDIDTGDWDEAFRLATVLRSMGFTPMVERSRSKGWHVWVFSDGPVLASRMRRALKVAYKTIDLQAREANPKAESLQEGQLGNYVRLPYKGGLVEPLNRQTMMTGWNRETDGDPVSATGWFNDFEPMFRTHPDVIHYWADKWIEPPRPKLGEAAITEDELRVMFASMPTDLFEFVRDGPRGFGDRSEGLVALAFKLKRAGYQPAETLAAVKAADLRWGKYHNRPDGEIYLADIVERTL